MDRFVVCWDELDDPRTGNAGLHDFHELLFIALCSVLCGEQGAVDMALFAKSKARLPRGVLTLASGVPSHDTFSGTVNLLQLGRDKARQGRRARGYSAAARPVISAQTWKASVRAARCCVAGTR